MIVYILIVNNKKVDLPSDIKIPINFQVNDIAELKDRQANYSQSFDVPLTDNNVSIFGNAYQVTSISSVPYRKNLTTLIANGVEVVRDGVTIVEESGDKLKLTIYSGLTDFFSAIDGLTINDIDLRDVDAEPFVEIKFTSIGAYWDADEFSAIMLPLFQNGFINDGDREIDLSKYYRLAIRVKTIIEAIFLKGGYTYSGAIFDDIRYKRLALPITVKKLKYSDAFIKAFGYGKFTLLADLPMNIMAGQYAPGGIAQNINKDNLHQPLIFPYSNMAQYRIPTPYPAPALNSFIYGIDSPPASYPNNWMMWGFSYAQNYPPSGTYWQMQGLAIGSLPQKEAVIFRARVWGKYKVKWSGTYYVKSTGNGTGEVAQIALRVVRLNGVIINTPNYKFITDAPISIVNDSYQEFRFYYEVETYLYDNEPLRFEESISSISIVDPNVPTTTLRIETGFKQGSIAEVTLQDEIQYGFNTYPVKDNSYLDIMANLPSITMKDMIKTICQMYGIVLMPDPANKNIRFVQFKEIAQNKSKSRDWSEKLILEKTPIKFRVGNYGQENHMRYSPDPLNTDGFGDGSFAIDDTTLSLDYEAINLPFAASPLAISALSLPMARIDMIDSNGDEVDPVQRIIYVKRDTPIDAQQFLLFEPTVATSYRSQYYKTWFNDDSEQGQLGFDKGLISENYTELTEALDRAKIITVQMMLEATDVADFDHSLPIYLRQFGSHFYVNKIKSWIQNQPCKVELIRI